MAKKKKKKKPAQNSESRPPVSEYARDLAFARVITDPAIFEQVKDKIKSDSFGPHEGWLGLVWDIVLSHHQETNELPDEQNMLAKVNESIDLLPDLLVEGDIDKINDLLAAAFESEKMAGVRHGSTLRWIREFLEDRFLHKVKTALNVPQSPADLGVFVGNLTEEANSLRLLGTSSIVEEPFELGWDDPGSIPVPTTTNISFIDVVMGGGTCPGESYGLMGPFGGGKTTAGVMIAVEAAKAAYNDWLLDRSQPADRAYHFTYEEPVASLRIRSLSYLAQIPRDRLLPAVNAKDYNLLNGPGVFSPYERVLFENNFNSGARVQYERERLEWALLVLNKTWRIIDMRGTDKKNPGRGHGLVDEVAAIVKHDLQLSPGVHCRTVIVDYVRAAVERHIDHEGESHDELRHYIGNWPFEMSNKIAVPLNCPVWSLHQLSTEANTFQPGREVTMTDSSEGRAFAEHLDFLFAIGKTNRDRNAIWWPCKHRRIAPPEPVVVELDGAMARFIGKQGELVLDRQSHAIVSRSAARALHGGDTASVPSSARPAAPDPSPTTAPGRVVNSVPVPAGNGRQRRSPVMRRQAAADSIVAQHSAINNGHRVALIG